MTKNFDSVRPRKSIRDPTVTDIRAILYLPTGIITTKLSSDDEFTALPQKKNLKCLHVLVIFFSNKPLQISFVKWQNLQDLKTVVQTDCHFFYHSLPYEEQTKEVVNRKQSLKTK